MTVVLKEFYKKIKGVIAGVEIDRFLLHLTLLIILKWSQKFSE